MYQSVTTFLQRQTRIAYTMSDVPMVYGLTGEHKFKSLFSSSSALEWIEKRLEGTSTSTSWMVETAFILDLDFGIRIFVRLKPSDLRLLLYSEFA